MKNNQTSSATERRPATGQSPARKSVLLLSAITFLVAIAVLTVARRHRAIQELPASPAQNLETTQTSDTAPLAPEGIPPVPAATSASPVAAATPGNFDRSAVARELMKRLSEVQMQPGGVTPESATQWQRDFEQLVEQGTAAIPPLEEFFQSQADVRFDSGTTNLLGEPTLRIAFIEVLFNIPAPENVNLQKQILRNTTDPAEVALLARQLEAQEPGTYQDLIVSTAQLSLAQARAGAWPGRDPAPLVKVLKQYGVESAR